MINKSTEAFDKKIKLTDDKVEQLGETMITNLAKSSNKLTKELGDLKVALDDLDTRQRTDTVQKSFEALDGNIDNIQQGQLEIPTQGDLNIEKTIIDMRDEEARKSNMIVYNTEESKEEAPRDRYRADTLFIHTLFRDQIGMTEFKEEYILNVTRLEKKQDVKNRPIWVKLDTQATKNSIFRNTAKLRAADKKYKQLGLEHDYTPKQQAERKKTGRRSKETTRS